ncbi:MAG: lysozyme inhibitor LprI family protein [Novosphingobium sp.]
MIAALLLMAAAPQVESDCGDLPQQPMNMCLNEVYQGVDAEMNREWKVVADAMKAGDRDLDRTYDKEPGWYDTLLAGQRAWLAWRDKQCLLESFDMRGGSGAPMLHALCMSRMTRERTKQLKSMVEDGN